MKAFCTAHGVPFETRGKLIVATDDLEMERLAALETRAAKRHRRAAPVGKRADVHGAAHRRPGCASRAGGGDRRLPRRAGGHAPGTGAGGELRLGSEVNGIAEQE